VLIQEQDIPKTYPADVLLKGSVTKPYQVDVLLLETLTKLYQADVIVGPAIPPPHVAVDLYAAIGAKDLVASSGKVMLYAKKKWEVELV